MINSVIIQGNLGKPPERHGKIVTFSIANKYSVKKDGVYSDETSWIKIVVLYPKQADACEKFLDKGSQVVVDGELRIREHDGKYYTEIIANKIEFVSVKKQEQELF